MCLSLFFLLKFKRNRSYHTIRKRNYKQNNVCFTNIWAEYIYFFSFCLCNNVCWLDGYSKQYYYIPSSSSTCTSFSFTSPFLPFYSKKKHTHTHRFIHSHTNTNTFLKLPTAKKKENIGMDSLNMIHCHENFITTYNTKKLMFFHKIFFIFFSQISIFSLDRKHFFISYFRYKFYYSTNKKIHLSFILFLTWFFS